MKYIIEFRNGSYFKDLQSQIGCDAIAAKRFETKEECEELMDKHDWILFNGGMIVPEPPFAMG